MFSVELKVNGALVAHLYGHNSASVPSAGTPDLCRYTYEFYEVGKPEDVKTGTLYHSRTEGLSTLVRRILEDIA